MSEQTNNQTPLSTLGQHAVATGDWWKSGAAERNELQLPGRVLKVLETEGIRTVEQLKVAGPHRLRKIEGLGKLAFNQIIDLLRALDRQNGGGET